MLAQASLFPITPEFTKFRGHEGDVEDDDDEADAKLLQ
jgi:hypothetical protein